MSESSNTSGRNDKYTPEERRALDEAQQVLESLEGTEHALDGFNLLGVVANPRAGGPSHYAHHERTMSRGSSHGGRSLHGRSSLHNTAFVDNSSSDQAASSSFYFADSTMQVLESTLSNMTEQIDVLNDALDYWSRQYLGVYDEAAELLEYTPPELSEHLAHAETQPTIDVSSLQAFLEQSGSMAQSFATSLARQQSQQLQQQQEQQESTDVADVERSIASLFFQDEFDLTDPATFMELLVRDDNEVNGNTDDQHQQQDESTAAFNTLPFSSSSSQSAVLSVSTFDLLKLPPPDYFTADLDRVEVSLLNQVRTKSSQFFHETNRFGLLQEWIASLVVECQRVRVLLDSLKQNSVQAWELIPLLDKKRREMNAIAHILDQAQDVVRCKASIGGLLSSCNQDLQAAEQIEYGRKLWKSEDVHGLVALSNIPNDLQQYEALVVANLGNELMEVFIDFHNNLQHKHRIPELVRGLTLCGALSETGVLYGNRLNDVIRMTVRTTVGEFAEDGDASTTTVKAGVTSMTLERFLDCLDMLFEQVGSLLRAAVGVKDFCKQEGIVLENEEKVDLTEQAVTSAAELSSKSISELLRLRKEAHSLVTLEEMKRLWDVCMNFTTQFENLTNYKATGLRSTLLAQAKAFVERKHESNMSALVAALESERWTQCDVSAERQDALTRLSLGRAVMCPSSNRLVAADASKSAISSTGKKKMADAEVEGVRYKVVWSCLLLVEMVMTDIACASQFKALATNMVGKVAELLRLFNSRSTQLVLGAGAIHSAARLKSINAKHLSLVTQCVGLIISILPQVRAALMAQLPAKQHTLLNDLDTIKREYEEHNEKVLNKFVNIIGGIVEHGLAPRIGNTSFDDRAKAQVPEVPIACCIFLEGISTNTRKMHQVLSALLPPDHLQDSFSRIFAYLDQKIPELLIAASVGNPPSKPPTFSLPTTDEGKKQMLLEVQTTTNNLNELPGVRPWDFSAISVLEQELDYKLDHVLPIPISNGPATASPVEDSSNEVAETTESPTVTSEKHLENIPVATESDLPETDDQQSVNPVSVENDTAPAATSSEPHVRSNGEGNHSQNTTVTSENGVGDSDHHYDSAQNANKIAGNENGCSSNSDASPIAGSNAGGSSTELIAAKSSEAAGRGERRVEEPLPGTATDDPANENVDGGVS